MADRAQFQKKLGELLAVAARQNNNDQSGSASFLSG